MSDVAEIDTGPGPSLSADESAFFESGGEKPIPAESGADTGATADGAGADPGTAPAAANDDAKTAKKNDSHVPLATFLEEKNARKQMATELAEMRGKFSILERLNAPAADKKDVTPAAPPTPEEDIFGAVKHVGETVAQMQKRLDESAAAETARTEQATFVNNYRADADAFQAKNADYREAYNFLLSSRATELIAIGYDDPNTLAASGADAATVHAARKALHDAIVADEAAIAQMGFAKKKSPAELIYNLAKQRGYKQVESKPEPGKGEGDAKLENIERGQQANKSLNNAGGSSGDAEMTAERLLAMPLDEFETWAEKNPAKVKRIMGG